MGNNLLTSATLDVRVLGVQIVFNTEETSKRNTPVTSIDIINLSYINPEKLMVSKIVGFDKDQGIKCFVHNSKRYIIGVCGEKHGTVFLINVDDKIYEEYAFVGSRDTAGDVRNIIIGDINRIAETRETFVEVKFDYDTIQHDDVTFSFAMDKESDVKFQFKYSDFHPDGVDDNIGYVRIIRSVIKNIRTAGMSNSNVQFRFFDFADRSGYNTTVSIYHMLDHSEWTITTRDKDGNMCDTISINTAKVGNTNFNLNTGSFTFRGCRYIISVGGDNHNSIIVINLSSNEAYQYNFKDVQSINISSIDCDDGMLGPIVKISGKLVKVKDNHRINMQYRAIIDFAFGITSFVDTELTPDTLDFNAHKEFIETAKVEYEILKVKNLYDYTKCKEDDTKKPNTAEKDPEPKKNANEGKKVSDNEKIIDDTTLMLMRSYHDIFNSLCKSAIYEVGVFSQFTREERLILAKHLDVVTTMIDKKLKEITASAEK